MQLALSSNDNPLEDFYWDLHLKDGRVIPIPPKGVPVVQRKITAKEPVVTTMMTIPFSEIKGFEKTSRKYGVEQAKLMEEVSQVFGEPIITTLDDGTEAVKARWVKRQVTQHEYASYYSKGGSYRNVGSEDGMVWIAYVLAVHSIDPNKHTPLTDEEIRKLT